MKTNKVGHPQLGSAAPYLRIPLRTVLEVLDQKEISSVQRD
jgi:hypothetical protein